MATTRYKGANSSERLTLSTLSDSDMFQTRHLPGTVNDADKGVSKALLQALPIAVCATAAATAAKVATLAAESCPDFTLVNGRVVHIYFSAANTASVPTLNLAGTGALPITYPDGSYVGEWPAGCCLDLMYISIVDGNTAIERWVLVSNLPVNEITANNMQSVSSDAVNKYIRDQILLSAPETISISTSSSSPTIMQYDGFIVEQLASPNTNEYVTYSINGNSYLLVKSSAVGIMTSNMTIPYKKGDSVYIVSVGNHGANARVMQYKSRDYSGR